MKQLVRLFCICALLITSFPLPFLTQAAPLPAPAATITRTEDSDPAIVYTGAWTAVTNLLFTRYTSHADFTESSAPGAAATFTFTGSWVHLGFATNRTSGQAEILIDGQSKGTVDLYGRDDGVASFAYGGLANTAHTLTIVVAGTSNPNASGIEVQLDFIDVWDGASLPAGMFEQDDPRIWTSANWDVTAEPAASGGTYAQTSSQGDNTAWFGFTGDTVAYHALATSSGGRAQLLVDGEYVATVDLYSSIPEPRVFSFAGFGPGPHVLTLRHFLRTLTLDAFSTPGAAPHYEGPPSSAIRRYEEYDPALRYNGESLAQRPQTWSLELVSQASDGAVLVSRAANDTVSLNFSGEWVNLGFRTRNRGGQAEVTIDGVSQGVIGLYDAGEEVISFQYGGLSPGAHTLTITVLGQPDPPSGDSYIYLDYIDVWDGSQLPDAKVNVTRSLADARLHFSPNVNDLSAPNAYQGDYAAASLVNANSNVWYAFTGDSFTFLAFSRLTNGAVEVYLDDVLLATESLVYPFSQQPLAFHYTGFSDGPHVARIHNVAYLQVDAFASNPGFLGPYQPSAEWWESDRTAGASLWGGIHVPVAAGDVTGDGAIELVVASSNVDNSGELFLMHGDGGAASGSDPILWSVPYNLPNGFEDVGAPAIAELDGQPGAEIIHPTADGLYVYHSDGSLYWMTDTLKSHAFFASPAVGNLDQDPEPEIAVNLDDTLVVFEATGSLAWQTIPGTRPGMPQLADLTGDGRLDLLFNDSDTLYLYDYNLGSPTLAWSHTFTSALQIYGAPAIADIDGQLTGGDPGPEIAIASEGFAHVLDADGTILWSKPLQAGRAGGAALADLDGDGEVEIVTGTDANGGIIYALNADGSLLWEAPALDNSPLSVSLVDLEGDGRYEVAWNGANQGLTLFNGADGAPIFSEPNLGVVSQTGSDYPVFADVDLDGYGELVVAAQSGVRVFGFDGYWGPARALWNQHSYHITNISDDLTVPTAEPDSWAGPNNYRAQLSPGQVQRGVGLTAAQTGATGEPGQTMVYFLTLTNTGNRADNFDLSFSGAQWDVQLSASLAMLAPGESRQITVQVTVPTNASAGQVDSVTIRAVSVNDPVAEAGLDLTTTAVQGQPGGGLYLPLVMK